MTAGGAHYVRESHRLAVPRALALVVVYLAVIHHHADNGAVVAALLAVMVVHGAACVVVGRTSHLASARSSALRAAAKATPEVACGFVSGWVGPVMLFIIYNALARDELDDRRARYVFAVPSLTLAILGIVHGVSGAEAGGALLGGTMAYVSLQRRMSMTRNLVDSLAERNDALLRAHQQLQDLHAHALAREKLSSLGMLAAGIAHEINNPMSYVTGNVNAMVEVLGARPDADPALREVIDELLPETLDGVRRVNSIVAEIRLFARGDPEGMVDYDLNAQVQQAVRMVRGSLPSSCAVATELADVPRATGFPHQLQVLINLIVNAADASEPGSAATVQVTTRCEGDWLVAQVRDRGCGMSAETCAKLFQPFFTTKPVGKGTGLGLPVAYGIVQTHRGRIEVESAVGQGTRIEVWLPVQPGLARLAVEEKPARSEVRAYA